MIIIEGQNGTGKTTLCHELEKQFNLQYLKIIKNAQTDTSKLNYKFYIENSTNLPQNILFDRFHFGEVVYPILKNDGRQQLKIYQQHAIERILNNRGALIIWCQASKEFIKTAFEKRGEDFIEFSQSDKEFELFNKAYNNSIMTKLIYSPEFSIEEKEQFLNKLKIIYNNLQKEADLLFDYQSSGKFIKNLIMLVGDKFNINITLPNLHAFSDYKGSSEYLQQALYLSGYSSQYYLTNSNKSEHLFLEEYYNLSPKIIISLGINSSNFLNKIGIPHKSLVHPQYYKRFINSNPIYYGNLLRKSIEELKC